MRRILSYSIVVAMTCALGCGGSGDSVDNRRQSQNNLKILGLALHNYADVHGSLPIGGTVAPDGTLLHGAHTRLLPFIEQQNVFQQVDFTKPWDDPVNRSTFQLEIPTFRNPGVTGEPFDAQGYAVTHYAENHLIFPDNAVLRFRDFTDGLANTIVMGEVAENFQPWGSPYNRRDLSLGLNTSPQGFGSPFRQGAHVLIGDGSVRFIGNDVPAEALRALATPSGNEVIRVP